MYGYHEYTPLNKDIILANISQEDIFKLAFKRDIIIGELYKAPYRNDINGDCYFQYANEKLWFIDFASTKGRHYKDCFDVLQECLNITHNSVLQYINNHFKLGLGDSTKEVEVQTVEVYLKEDRKKTITYTPRLFNNKDKTFWQKYGITKQNLIEDKVEAVKLYRGYSKVNKVFTIKPFDLTYAYTDFKDNKVKIYRPEALDKKSKWFTNCNQNDLGNINNLPEKGDYLIITKSYKDCRVLRNLGLTSIWLQAESMFPTNNILEDLGKRFNKIIVWLDNDQTGMARSKELKDLINKLYPNKANTVFIAPKFLKENIKDPSDYIAKFGRAGLIEFIKENKILNKIKVEYYENN